jgi:inosine/xanthosine triphosphate pyrophosphatase family protein
MPRTLYLMTSNHRKWQEYQRRFSHYGIRVQQVDKAESSVIAQWLEDPNVTAVMRERSNLYEKEGGHTLRTFQSLQVAVNRTELVVYTKKESEEIQVDSYEQSIPGHIDMSRRVEGQNVFDWDDIFVPQTTLRSYHEMRLRGLKLSARDLVISDFVRAHLWYRNRIQLNWTPVENSRSIDFATNPVHFLKQHPIYQTIPRSHPLYALLHQPLREGLFFRSAKNRREKNYWMPGLNAGVPLVPKRDDVHEATFMFHDFMHFVFPDLIFDGQTSQKHQNTYIVHRMMSEAFTLVLADMVFVSFLKEQGVRYDFDQRRIFPLFQSMECTSHEQLLAILHANTRYCLTGDESEYQQLGADPEALSHFRNKYEQFFVSDFRWTQQNFRSMSRGLGERAQAWLELISPIQETLSCSMMTVHSLVNVLHEEGTDFSNLDMLVEAIFKHYVERLKSALATTNEDEGKLSEQCLTVGFKRYMMGQMAIFIVYDFLPESGYFSQQLVRELSSIHQVTLADVHRIRGFYEQYVDLLFSRHLISEDDCDVFKEVFPIFDPFYVDYDVSLTTTLREIAHSIVA